MKRSAKRSAFGNWLYEWRKTRKLTQGELAALAQCSDSIISAHETGKKQEQSGDFIVPEPELVEKLATALDRPVKEARALAGYMPSPAPVTMQTLEDVLMTHQGFEVGLKDGNLTITGITKDAARVIAQEILAGLMQQVEVSGKNDK